MCILQYQRRRCSLSLIGAFCFILGISSTTPAQELPFAAAIPSSGRDFSGVEGADGHLPLISFNELPFALPASASPSSAYSAPIGTTLSSFRPVHTSVVVNASVQTALYGIAAPYHATQAEILAAAGSYGDAERYLQMMPSAVWLSDESNDLMIRGGNPAENLFVVDGIEVPNINHIALEGTTGGFTSMIDTSTIGSVDMKPGVYDARYSSRLSSLIDIHTLENKNSVRSGEAEAGISGAGGFVDQPISKHGSLLLTAHHSLLNFFTNDIGLNGVPIYTNGMAQLDLSPGERDQITALSLNGEDSIDIQPCTGDWLESLNIDTQYQGTQSTSGLVWQHTHNPTAISTLTGSYSLQSHNIAQQLQYPLSNHKNCQQVQMGSSVYQEETHDGIYNLGYGHQRQFHSWLFSFGSTGRLLSLNDAVAQPAGQQSPFNANSAWTDANSFTRHLWTGQTGSYFEVNGHPGTRWSASAGLREETFALVGGQALEPQASIAFRINSHQALNAEFGRSAQLAPTINILSYAQNASLKPLVDNQFSMGANLWSTGPAKLSLQAYHKSYSNEPASTEYPSLMMANMVDTLGQQFVWLPMTSVGRGQAEGLEAILHLRAARRLQIMGTASYGRTRYAAADGVMRPGNFDLPLVVNALATLHLPKAIQLSLRNTFASGRPYTPFNISASEQQNRGIYNLTQINALRGPLYNRFDFQFSRDFHLRRNQINVQAGLENALNRENFLGYAWMDNCSAMISCVAKYTPYIEVTQMPLFPSFSAKYIF
jgi:hypothetical protein